MLREHRLLGGFPSSFFPLRLQHLIRQRFEPDTPSLQKDHIYWRIDLDPGIRIHSVALAIESRLVIPRDPCALAPPQRVKRIQTQFEVMRARLAAMLKESVIGMGSRQRDLLVVGQVKVIY